MRILAFLLATAAFAAPPTLEIKLDQAGYLPGARKLAIVASGEKKTAFTIRRKSDSSVAFTGTLTTAVYDADTSDNVQFADFTSLDTPGTYFVDIKGVGESWPFRIGRDVYDRVFYLAARSYYGQRCGIAVDLGPEFPGYKHDACHLQGAYHATSGKSGDVANAGGWHDAGDYGRYVVNSGLTTGTLLWTYELFGPRAGKVKLDLPESGNNTPDLLNEIRWNLRWMLSLQDTDGGVWHKQTSEKFCGFVMPEKDTLVSYIIGTGSEPFKSSCATGDFAAVMAIAARVYKPFDAKFAGTCLTAARKAYAWLQQHPNILFQNPPGISTGGYGDRSCNDEALWAAAELWRTTRDAAYKKDFVGTNISAPGWPNVASMGLWTYALANPSDAAAAAIRKATEDAANRLVARAADNPYRTTMSTRDYVWGSNSVVANQALLLLVANAFQPDRRYFETALDDLHYLLGRNTFSLSWVTQVGANPFRHPHHRPSAADKNPEPWPGLLSGGPNHSKQDPAMRKLPDLAPAKMYLDDQESYASNEVAINWNAPLVFLLAGAMSQ